MNLLILFIAIIASYNVRLTIADGMNCSLGFFFNGTNCDECGLRSVLPNIRIVGGVVANPNSWPAQALIIQITQDEYGNMSVSRCGATLINLNTILTAAHCIDFDIQGENCTVESSVKVFLGAHNVSFLEDDNVPASVIVRNVSKIIPHENYDPSTVLNDIALIILDSPVTLSPTVQVACLPEQGKDFPQENVTAYAAGWGKTNSSSDDLPNLLMNVNLTVYNPLLCQNGSLNGSVFVWDSQICAGEYSGGKDTCQGDSGSGLIVPRNINSKNKDFVAGIVSYGYGCALPEHPGIFTRTSYYINWIQNNIYNNMFNNDTSNTANVTLLPYSPPTTITTMRPQNPSRVCKYGTFDNGASCEVCGRKNGNATYPSTVAILVYDTTNSPNNTLLAICAGMAVNRETVLSTKSCVINNTDSSKQLDSFAVFTTAENISLVYPNSSDNSSPGNVVIKLKAVKKNPNSDAMALFILKTPLPQTNQDVNIGCLPANTSFAPPVNRKCAERGVRTLDNFKASLYSIDLKIIDCNNNSANSANNTRLCAVKDTSSSRSARDTSSSSCDSSGLLVVPDTVDGSSSFVVAGVTNGCQNGTTREFLSSASTVDWISSNLVVTDTTNTTNTTNTTDITSQVTTASSNISNITSQFTTATKVSAISNFTNVTSIAITSLVSNATVPLTTTPKGQCKYGAFYNGSTCEVCGRSNKGGNNNGTSYPTVIIVAVFNATNTSNTTLLAVCVGMLVNRETILSIKDCIINITSGSTNLDSFALISSNNNISLLYPNQTTNDSNFTIIKLKSPKKDPNNNIIALFTLKTPILNNQDVNIGCLPSGRTYAPGLNKKCSERGVRLSDNNTAIAYSIDLKISNCDNSSSNSTLCAVRDIQTRSIRAIYSSCDSLGSVLLVSDTTSDGSDSSVVAGVSNGCQSGTTRQFTSSASSVDWISANVVVSSPTTTTTSSTFSMTIRNQPSFLLSTILVVIGIFGFRNY